jgi:hypothetical protein
VSAWQQAKERKGEVASVGLLNSKVNFKMELHMQNQQQQRRRLKWTNRPITSISK